jgi:hypothetical protein
MKKHIASVKIVVAALGLLLLAACVNPLGPPRDKGQAEIAGGKGLVRIAAWTGGARTALPAAVFHHFGYLFSKNGGSPEALAPTGGAGEEARFELEPGNWTVTLNAYAGEGDDTLAAAGSADFTVVLQQEIAVSVSLSPVVGEGEGALNYILRYPGDATVSSFTLTLLAGSSSTDLKNGTTETVTAMKTLTGRLETVTTGYYLARAVLKKDGVTVEKTEVVHIYRGMTTELSLEVTANAFKALIVLNSANSGPGSLRDTISAALPGATILINLPENSRVITLAAPLVIDKSLTILGNGSVLTQSGSNRLMTLTGGSGVTVRISRLHFRGGRSAENGGAINSAVTLVLESCIFSDNETEGVEGGALYTSVAAIVRGSTFYGNRAAEGGAISANSGSLFIEGNIFWAHGSAIYGATATVESGGFNVYDSGSSFGGGDIQAGSLPLSPLSFKPLPGGSALGAIPSLPEEYPELDFQGQAIPAADGAAGALQAPARAGYVLEYAAQGPGTVSVAGTVDEDGVVSGSVTLTARDAANGAFRYWTVNGAERPAQTPPATLTLTLSAHTDVRAVFYTRVTSSADSGTGSLRSALETVEEGSGVILPSKGNITMSGDLERTQSIVIEGNEATLNLNGYHLKTGGIGPGGLAKIRISRLHITKGRSTANGGAIENEGILTLESCIFSDNEAAGNGGVIYHNSSSGGALTVLGSTFYGNRANSGGAIYTNAGTLTLRGNLFWANTAAASYPIVCGTAASAEVRTQGSNVTDIPSGAGSGQSGWVHQSGDKQGTSLPLSPVSFKPLAGGGALNALAARPADYPALDFYGEAIPAAGAAAGAAQTAIPVPDGSYVLDYARQGGPGTVNAVGTVDANGIASGSVTLKAVESSSGTFRYWIKDGIKQSAQLPPDEFTVTGSATVRAVFYTRVTSADSGPGSLREALAGAAAWDGVIIEDQTIALAAPLPGISKSFTIEGKGATLTTQPGFTASTTSQLLRITGAAAPVVSIRGLHFTGGRTSATGGGPAVFIDSSGANVTLESCIFSDNRTAASSGAYGGAVYAKDAAVSISGCTFYGNFAYQGGALYKTGSGAMTVTGNIFWGNTANSATSYPVAFGSISSASYNLSDTALGTSNNQAGWAAGTGNQRITSLPMSSLTFRLRTGDTALNAVTTPPAGYPAKDFYGDAVLGSNAAAGAVQGGAAGWILDYAPQGSGTVSLTGGNPDDSGFFPASGTATLTAAPSEGKDFICWTVNGSRHPQTTASLTLTMDGDKTVRAVFASAWRVTSNADSGDGTLRAALNNTALANGDYIIFDLPEGEKTIRLGSVLPTITRSLVIEGNGTTLTSAGPDIQLLKINLNTAGVVRISRLHFKGGRNFSTYTGGAVSIQAGDLFLESCIFSDNWGAWGGAVYSLQANITARGCTFYGNVADDKPGGIFSNQGEGGALLSEYGNIYLEGNVFWGNTASLQFPVALTWELDYNYVTSSGYNVADVPMGTGTTQSGWASQTGDTEKAPLHLNPADYTPFADSPAVGTARIPVRPDGYPTLDFYGNEIPATDVSAGAVQTPNEYTGNAWLLDYAVEGPGTVSVTSGSVEEGGFTCDSSLTLAANETSNALFKHWLVTTGASTTTETNNPLTLTITGNTSLLAVFDSVVNDTADSGTGTLRWALQNAGEGSTIIFSGAMEIALAGPLPEITKSLTIEGNGSVLTRTTAFTESNISQLLRINGTTATAVTIRRLHFKGGRATNNGAAIESTGGAKLTLESCIFSDNRTSAASAHGGAIGVSTNGSLLTVFGCTFFGNQAGSSASTTSQGGAIYKNGTGATVLKGNLFWGNTANQRLVYTSAAIVLADVDFNVSDKVEGTSNGGTGWPAGGANNKVDTGQFVGSLSFKPTTTVTATSAAKPANYPTEDFSGATITGTWRPGAFQSTASDVNN